MAGGDAQQVVVDGRAVSLTNLDKVLYPATGTTKGEVIAYYAEVGRVLVPHLRQRPITRKRWPDGTGAEGDHVNVFFAKNLPKGTPDWVRRYPITHSEGTNDYPVADDVATLVWLAQLAALELHVPQWRFAEDGTPLPPDRLVLDLDPGEGVDLAGCAEVAGWVREVLDGAGLPAYPVTSGSKGIHLYAHLDGSLDPAGASALAKELAEALQAEHPDRVTAVMRRTERPGKVFIDWSQNNGNKTTITPYSLRGRTRPTVAAPRTWDELADPDLRHLEFGEVLARLADAGDLLAALAPDASPADQSSTVPEERAQRASRRAAATDDRLATYRGMRDATKTPEPVPSDAPQHTDGRSFVIQEHHARRLHYDFRLERDGVLVSWAVPKGPPTDPKQNHLAVPTEDHPLAYGSFEGTIPKGEYGGGTVTIWDAGTYELEKWRDAEVIVVLHGRPDGGLGGSPARFALIRTGKDWLMHRMALPEDQLPSTAPEERAPSTVPEERAQRASRRAAEPSTVPEEPAQRASRRAPATTPEALTPMLATLATPASLGDEDDWAFEMKWDGVRAIVRLDHGSASLTSRSGRDETARYPDLIPDLAALPCDDAVLDGEIVVLDPRGAPDFGLLQPRINLTKATDIAALAASAPAQLMLFDLLALNGQDLTAQPYEVRRELLASLEPTQAAGRVHVPPEFHGDLASALDASLSFHLEGVVAKRRGSPYEPGRRARTWLKIKHTRAQSVVVGGWRPGQGNRAGSLGSLLVAVPDGDRLVYVGRVGSGFTDAGLKAAQELLAPLATDRPGIDGVPAEDARDARWVEPVLVGEVTYAERTGPGRLRAPVWRGWRPDQAPGDVVWEEATQ
ncbi:MAG: ATP-dependent DNA ligase [Propionicimonas sp.]|uniref:ATP-dependent DNA ligase n=1 Tax=Propionicimonas sp. TaxID=1955623 RepID=UPI003D0E280F